MTNRVRKTTLLLLIVTISTISSPTFGQTPQNSSGQVIKGKNVTVYLEDADFGILAERFAYDPNARLVDIQDEKSAPPIKNTGSILTAHFVNTNTPSVQPASLKKMVPRPLGTSLSPKPLPGKPQSLSMEELSFDFLSRVPSI